MSIFNSFKNSFITSTSSPMTNPFSFPFVLYGSDAFANAIQTKLTNNYIVDNTIDVAKLTASLTNGDVLQTIGGITQWAPSSASNISYSKEFFVDPINGLDTNNGDQNHPFQTITFAISACDGTGHVINILQGIYNESINVNISNINFIAKDAPYNNLTQINGNLTFTNGINNIGFKNIRFNATAGVTVVVDNTISNLQLTFNQCTFSPFMTNDCFNMGADSCFLSLYDCIFSSAFSTTNNAASQSFILISTNSSTFFSGPTLQNFYILHDSYLVFMRDVQTQQLVLSGNSILVLQNVTIDVPSGDAIVASSIAPTSALAMVSVSTFSLNGGIYNRINMTGFAGSYILADCIHNNQIDILSGTQLMIDGYNIGTSILDTRDQLPLTRIDPSTAVLNDVLTFDGTNWIPQAASGGGFPVSDSVFLVQNTVDPTKQMDLDLSNILTGQTRTLIMSNRDINLQGPTFDFISLTNLINSISIYPHPSFSSYIMRLPDTIGLPNQFLQTDGIDQLTWANPTTSTAFADNAFSIFDNITPSNTISFTVAGLSGNVNLITPIVSTTWDFEQPNVNQLNLYNGTIANQINLLPPNPFISPFGIKLPALVGNSGQVLSTNGVNPITTSWVNQTTTMSNSQFFTSSGTFNVPANITLVYVKLQGCGGGGSSNAFNATASFYPGSGSGGGYCEGFVTVTPSTAITVTLGTPGTGAAAGIFAGTNGGTSSFGTFLQAFGGFSSGAGSNQNAAVGGSYSINAGASGFGVNGMQGNSSLSLTGSSLYLPYGGGTYSAPINTNVGFINGPTSKAGQNGLPNTGQGGSSPILLTATVSQVGGNGGSGFCTVFW